jgi:hypothetical protein
MPQVVYPVSGYCYNVDGVTGLPGVSFNAINKTTGKKSSTTSGENGEYVISVESWTVGDVLTIEGKKGRKIVQYVTTVLEAGSEEKNLTMTYFDVLSMIVDILTDNWTKERTDLKTPVIDAIQNVKRIPREEMSMQGIDYVLVYELRTRFEKNSIGKLTKRIINPVSIDIRTMNSREHFEKLFREVDRILNSVIVNPTSEFDILDPDGGFIDLSDRSVGLWRGVYDVSIERGNSAR